MGENCTFLLEYRSSAELAYVLKNKNRIERAVLSHFQCLHRKKESRGRGSSDKLFHRFVKVISKRKIYC
jgi:hypothetical protein